MKGYLSATHGTSCIRKKNIFFFLYHSLVDFSLTAATSVERTDVGVTCQSVREYRRNNEQVIDA